MVNSNAINFKKDCRSYRFFKRSHAFLKLLIAVLGINNLVFAQEPIDSQATHETKALYFNLKNSLGNNFMVGHQEGQAYGVNWKAERKRSDVKDVCGDYAAVHGWDVGKEGELRNLDGVLFSDVRKLIKRSYKRGGVNTISWHGDNPTSGGGTWDTTRTVKHILPGGKDHDHYVKRLDKVADFLNSCKVGNTKIPIIFRPFHEHNGDWFWWGKKHCREEEYIALWRFTVNYLRDKRNIHHVLYTFSPDASGMNTQPDSVNYLYGYPGDEYVDILGLDNYRDVGIQWNTKPIEEQKKQMISGLTIVSDLAKQKNKVAAFTETGLEGVTETAWYTQRILEPIKANANIQLAYVMLWRNANSKHHYAPYPGHASVPDFLKFFNDSCTLFERDLPKLYLLNGK
jgi:mannan endo-1,4-beta-mannosidase